MSARREHNGLRGLTLAGCCSVAAPSALRLHSNELAAYPNDMAGRKRKNLSFEQLQPHFQQTLKDAAAALDLSVRGLFEAARHSPFCTRAAADGGPPCRGRCTGVDLWDACRVPSQVNGLKKTCRRNGITSWPYRKVREGPCRFCQMTAQR